MEADFWHEKWEADSIGFHQARTNKHLQQWWPEAEIARNSEVFVPLCGKSLDMLWLHEQGYKVTGIELSEIAIESFFKENDLSFERHTDGSFEVFSGTGKAEGIKLLAGDFFALTADHCCTVSAVYDRASLIAMNDDLRPQYAQQLALILPPGSITLMLVIDYDASKMQGPPFPVSAPIVTKLFAQNFDIQELAHYSGPEYVGNLSKRGLDSLEERVFRLHRL